MHTHPKKKVEIIVERPLLPAVLDLVDGLGATGYTVFSTERGRGQSGSWKADDISGASDRVMVLVITSKEVADRIVARAYEVLESYTAIVLLSDVAVVRRDHF